MKVYIKQLFGKRQTNNFVLSIIALIVLCGIVYFFWRQYSHPPYSEKIAKVLQQAGSNRNELEKVLRHYNRRPVDSLKLRAAEFLIENMPGKYSVGYDAPWESVATVCLRWTSSSNKQLVVDTYQLGEQITRKDLQYITADYLINNIELAFKVWRETPWGKHITFDTFCEEILPYRVDTEPLENWREKVLTGFAEMYNELKNDPSMTSVNACTKVNSILPWFRMDKDFPTMNYSTLMASRRNTCVGMATLAIFTMRAMGIPVTYDYTIQYPHSLVGHSWNTVIDSAGNHISFMGTQSAPGESHQVVEVVMSKIYRKTYARQNPIQTDDIHIPPELNQIKDVSGEYPNCIDIDVPVHFPPVVNTGYAYLAILLPNASGVWNPTAWGEVKNQYIHYEQVGKNVLYLPIYYANNRQTPAGYPFYLDSIGNMQSFEPDTSSLRQHVFYESSKHPDNKEPTKIASGTTYELLYWNGANWQSLGKQLAKDASVSFYVPDNALLHLRIDGRDNNFSFFNIQNNKQNWLIVSRL